VVRPWPSCPTALPARPPTGRSHEEDELDGGGRAEQLREGVDEEVVEKQEELQEQHQAVAAGLEHLPSPGVGALSPGIPSGSSWSGAEGLSVASPYSWDLEGGGSGGFVREGGTQHPPQHLTNLLCQETQTNSSSRRFLHPADAEPRSAPGLWAGLAPISHPPQLSSPHTAGSGSSPPPTLQPHGRNPP